MYTYAKKKKSRENFFSMKLLKWKIYTEKMHTCVLNLSLSIISKWKEKQKWNIANKQTKNYDVHAIYKHCHFGVWLSLRVKI